MDPAIAQAALTNPATTAADLALIAQYQPALRTQVASHPAAYDDLLTWLAASGDPAVAAAVQARRAPQPAPGLGAASAYPDFAPHYQGPATPGFTPTPYAGQPAWGTAQAPHAAQSTWGVGQVPLPAVPPKKKHRGLLIGGIALVVVALVAAGLFTAGFGLLSSGGSKTPEAEALRLADKATKLINSFSVKSLLNNPIGQFRSISQEIAPSEAALTGASTTTTNWANLLGVSNQTITWLADLAGSFSVRTSNLAVNTYYLTDNLAYVRFIGGAITMTANSQKLGDALSSTSAVIDQQLIATAKVYGFNLNVDPYGTGSLGQSVLDDTLGLPSDWVDQAKSSIDRTFPYHLELGQQWQGVQDCLHQTATTGTYGGDLGACSYDYSSYLTSSGLVMVKEGGKWYLSSMLMSQLIGHLSFGSAYLYPDVWDANKDWIQANWSNLALAANYTDYNDWAAKFGPSPDWTSLFSLVPAQHASPIEATSAFFDALANGNERAVLAELPLAERRFAAFIGLWSDIASSGVSVSGTRGGAPRFEVITQQSGRATIRVDDLAIGDDYSTVNITNGTCLSYTDWWGDMSPSYCLADALRSDVTSGIDQIFGPDQAQWRDYGIDPQQVNAKLKTVLQTMADAIDPNAIGLVAVTEGTGWHLSVIASVSQLSSQIMAAFGQGLAAAQR